MSNGSPSPFQAIAVVGPTASGKSALADAIACSLETSVVSADAMQVYRGMDIGTAKTPPDQRPVPLLCIDLVEPNETYSVALYMEAAHRAIDLLVAEGRVPVVCGGTGLYVRAALEDMVFPSGDQEDNPVRSRYERLADQMGPQAFHDLLCQRDPASAALIHPNNVRRVVRAFELLEQGGSYAASNSTLHDRNDRLKTLYIGLTWPRETLYKRIDERVDRMFELGLMDEVVRMREMGFEESLTSRQAIGYKELFDVLNGNKQLAETVEEIKRSTRRYAKRQMTWFKSDNRIVWLDASKPMGQGSVTDGMRDYVLRLFRGEEPLPTASDTIRQ